MRGQRPEIRVQKSTIRRFTVDLVPRFSLLASSAFTLLEVVLALAILAGSLAVIGEVVRLANRNAELASDEAQAQMLAATVMSELLSGARELAAVNGVPFPDMGAQPRWLYSIRVEPLTVEELVTVSVQAIQDLPPDKEPARWEFVRWFVNPDYLPTQESGSGSQSAGSALEGASP